MRRIVIAALCVAVLAFVAAGCAAKQPQLSNKPLTDTMQEPLWVSKGVNAFPQEVGKAFYGVGVAEKQKIPDVYLRRKSSIERGRGEVASQLRTMVMGVFKDYTESAFTPSMDKGEIQTMTTNVQKSVLDEVLLGAEPRDMWVHPSTGDQYALIRVSMDSVAQQLRAKIISIEKDKLKKDATEAHKELDDIIEKHRKQGGV